MPAVPAARLRPGRPASLYRPLGFVMVRAPLLPHADYPAGGGADLPNGSGALGNDQVRRALAVASLPLAAALAGNTRTGRERERLRSGLLRYLIRMSTRPTPFGLCAGVALAGWGEETDLSLSGDPPAVHARPDMAGLLHLVAELESRPEIRRGLRVVANPAARRRGGRVALSGIEAETGVTGGQNVTIRATGAVLRALALAREAIGYAELARSLVEAVPGATADKVEGLLERLWFHGFLITDLRPPLTLNDPAGHVAARLREIPAGRDVGARLETLLAELASWAALEPGEGAARYPDLAARVGRLTGSSSGTPLQVDMVQPLAGRSVSALVAQEATRAAELLLLLTPFPSGPPSIISYREAFEARYGIDRDVPLLELIDPVEGLGLPPPLPVPASTRPAAGQAQRDRTLLALATSALHDHRPVVDLDEETLDRLRLWTPVAGRVPLSLDLYALVAARSAEAVDAGDFRLVVGPNVGAGAAGRNLGRFAGPLGPEAGAALAMVGRAEQELAPGRVLAELVYLPEKARTANVVVRPAVREYEVGMRVSAHPGRARFIALDDLVVRLHRGALAVVWNPPGEEPREIIICAGHMLNHVRAPAVCRFLADLSRDGTALLSGFDWGPARGFPYLPRVQVGRCVLALAQWRVDIGGGVPGVGGAGIGAGRLGHTSREDFPAVLAGWRRHWGVPRHVFMRTSADAADRELLLDLTDPAHAEELRRETGRLPADGQIIMREAYPGFGEAWVSGPGGRHGVELVVSMVQRAVRPPVPVRPVRPPVARAVRLRPPHSEWSYLRLYCGAAEEEAIIAGPLREFGVASLASARADRWYFLRYSDPEPHLRLRLRGAPRGLVPELCDWAAGLMSDELVSRFALDSYDREVERYGGPAGMAVSEAIHCADSLAVAEILRLDLAGGSPVDRLLAGMVSIDDLLAGLGLSEPDRLAFYRQAVGERRMSGPDYRRRKREFCAYLRSPLLAGLDDAPELRTALITRRENLERSAATLRGLGHAGELGKTVPELARSYVHLHCNRLFGRDRGDEHTALELLRRTRAGLAAGA